jgi:hypothetical protein
LTLIHPRLLRSFKDNISLNNSRITQIGRRNGGIEQEQHGGRRYQGGLEDKEGNSLVLFR